MHILGIDPGETTGIFALNLQPLGSGVLSTMGHDQVVGLSKLYNIIDRAQPDLIVCEGFDRRQKPGNIVSIIKGIAMVDLYVERTGIPLEMQSASYGKGFWDNGKLKRVGAYSPKMKHANDAARHVLQYLSNKGNDKRFIMMLKPEDFAVC